MNCKAHVWCYNAHRCSQRLTTGEESLQLALNSLAKTSPTRYRLLMDTLVTAPGGGRSPAARSNLITYLKVMVARKVASKVRGYEFLTEVQAVLHWMTKDGLSESKAKQKWKSELALKEGTPHVVDDEGELCLAVKLPMRVEMREELEESVSDRAEVHFCNYYYYYYFRNMCLILVFIVMCMFISICIYY